MAHRRRPLGWVSRDGMVVITARGIRTFALGSVSVLLAIYLDMLGFWNCPYFMTRGDGVV